MSLERDGELRAQLNLPAASLTSRICTLYMIACACSRLCVLAFSALAPFLAITVLGVKAHLWTN